MREPEQHRLQHDLRVVALAEPSIRVQLGHLGQHAQQIAHRKAFRALCERWPQVCADARRFGPFQPCDQHGPQDIGEAAIELGQVVAFVEQPLDEMEDIRHAPFGQDVEQLQIHVLAHQAQNLADVLHGQAAIGEGQHLVQQGQGVPHAAFGPAGEEHQGLVVAFHAFAGQHLLQPFHDGRHADPSEIEPLTPRQHRRRRLLDLLRLRRRKHEDHPGRRLLQDLEEGVPRVPRQHMGFVDDVDLEPIFLGGGVHRAFAQVPRIIDAPVGCGVDLHDIQGRAAGPDPLAGLALPARLAVRAAVGAVQSHGQHARHGGLAHAARSGEQVGVGDTVPEHGGTQRIGDVFLRYEFTKPSGTVLPGEGGARHRVSLLIQRTVPLTLRGRPAGGNPGAGRGACRKKRRPRLIAATSASLTAATCGVLTGFARSRPAGLGRAAKVTGPFGRGQPRTRCNYRKFKSMDRRDG